MQKQFVTYEIAKLLKDNGFREPCLRYYRITPFSKGEQVLCYSDSWLKSAREVNNHNLGEKLTAAPLWQQAIDWLREKHEIEIVITGITVNNIRKYHVCLYHKIDEIMTDYSILAFNEVTEEYIGYQTFTMQEAKEKAILEAIKLIP